MYGIENSGLELLLMRFGVEQYGREGTVVIDTVRTHLLMCICMLGRIPCYVVMHYHRQLWLVSLFHVLLLKHVFIVLF